MTRALAAAGVPHPADVPLPADGGRYGIGWMAISYRASQALQRAGIVDRHQIAEGWERLGEVRGIGISALGEIRREMEECFRWAIYEPGKPPRMRPTKEGPAP